MKKYILTLLVAAMAVGVNAQTEVLKINLGDTIVTYNIADIQEMTFEVIEEKVDTTLFHSFNGYIIVSSKYFQDSYYGNDATLSVYKTSKGEYIVTFSDPTWGDAVFGNVGVGRQLSGEGTIKMENPRGGFNEYEATISGPMSTPVITVPSVMGGTVITFHVGTAPAGYLVAGKYPVARSVTLPSMPQVGVVIADTVNVTVSAGSDPATVNITVPSCTYHNMVLPELNIEGLALAAQENGSYTIAETPFEVTTDQATVTGTVSGILNADKTISLVVTEKYGNMPHDLRMELTTPVEKEQPEFSVAIGSHEGDVSVMVGGQFGPYLAHGVSYVIEPNEDGTINVVIPAMELNGTVMGDLSLGSYTIKNLAFDKEKGSYYRDYANDGLTFHLTAVNNGATTMDNDYSFSKMGNLEVKGNGEGVMIINSFQPGAMPFPIVAVFEN